MNRILRLLGIAGVLSAATIAPAAANVVLSGPDANDGSYSTAMLATTATAGDTVNNGTLTGISLWGLLGGANAASPTSATYGAITTSTPAGYNGKTAKLLGIDIANVRVNPAEIGGGFGGKTLIYLEPVAVRLSKKTGRPVKIQMTRDESVPRFRSYLRRDGGSQTRGEA